MVVIDFHNVGASLEEKVRVEIPFKMQMINCLQSRMTSIATLGIRELRQHILLVDLAELEGVDGGGHLAEDEVHGRVDLLPVDRVVRHRVRDLEAGRPQNPPDVGVEPP